MKETLLEVLSKYPLCDFFLHECVNSMSTEQIEADLKAGQDFSLLQHFDKPHHMKLLENLFDQTMRTFRLEKEQLKTKSEFNFDTYDQRGFESVRGVFRFANAAAEMGFTDFEFVTGEGLADLEAQNDGERWFIEVKTLVLQLKEKKIDVGNSTELLVVDKFQPDSNSISDYTENVSRQIAANLVEKARSQLTNTVKQRGEAKKMVAVVINLFGGDFFLDVGNLKAVHARLRGQFEGWELDYLANVDALAFFTDTLCIFFT